MVAGWHQPAGRLPAAALRLHGWTADVAHLQTMAYQGCLLDQQPGHRRPALDALHRRQRDPLDERPLRRCLHHRALPAACMVRCFGTDDRQNDHPRVQIPGGYLLPPLHGALPLHVPLLRLGMEERAHLRADMARGAGAALRQHPAGMARPEALR